jgi:arsenate reductase
MTKHSVFDKIEQTITSLNTETISASRKEVLEPLVHYIKEKTEKGEPIALNFICTHNSRRSHLSQIWAQVMAHYLGLKNVRCYSGGTEATAMFEKVSETLSKQGFEIQKLSETQNPIYAVKFSENEHPIICFSKKFDDTFNPKSDFGAIMTCDSANEACPIISGAEKRFPITYQDPKKFDDTPQQNEKYMERSIQIATEMLFVIQAAVGSY